MIRSAIFDGPGQPLRFVDLPAPALAAGDALVRIRLCTLCGSDLHTFTGRRHGPTPCVLGHEMVGEITDMATDRYDSAGEQLRIGDRVTWCVADHCGRCFYCTRQLPQKCERLRKYGHHAQAETDAPAGGLASHCRLWPGTAVVKVPDSVPDEAAAPAMCATATVAGALRQAGHLNGATVLVLGAGMLGLAAAAMAASNGAEVVVADTNEQRLKTSANFGATHTSLVSHLDERLAEWAGGRGADVVLELAGVRESVETAIKSARIGGTVVLVGSVFPVGDASVNPETVVRRCLRILGSHNYTPIDLVAAVEFLAGSGGKYPFGTLVSRTYELPDASQAFHYAETAKPYRVGVRP